MEENKEPNSTESTNIPVTNSDTQEEAPKTEKTKPAVDVLETSSLETSENTPATPTEDNSSTEMPATEETAKTEEETAKTPEATASVNTGKVKAKSNTTVVLVAVLIMLMLIGGAIYAYLQRSTKSTNNGAESSTSQTATDGNNDSTTPQQELDATAGEIDESINEIDSGDKIESEELSDDKLSL